MGTEYKAKEFDFDKLRDDIRNEYLGSYFGGGFGGALIALSDVDNMSDERLIDLAKELDINIYNYEI